MKIVSWNVNGLRSILEKGFESFLRTEDPDICCLQEIKANADQLESLWEVPQPYHAYWNSADKKGYSGTLVLSKKTALSCHNGISEPIGDAEGRCQSLDFGSFYLVNVYTPNAKNDLSRLDYRTRVWDLAFRTHCSALKQKKPVVFCGDLNVAHKDIDLANPKSNRKNAGFTDEERYELDQHFASGFLDSFRLFNSEPNQYTWWSYRAGARSRNIGWRIDYVCISENLREKIKSAFIRQSVLGSDHCPVGIEIDF